MEIEEDNSSAGFSPQERERIVRGFEAWLDQYLDRAMADEPAPQGLTADLLAALENGEQLPPLESDPSRDGGCDLYSLWAAMTALTQEVRLQGRTFKQLNETLSQSAQSLDTFAAETRRGGDELTRAQQAEARPARKQEIHLPLNVLLDLRDRVERGSNTARNAAEDLAQKKLPPLARLLGVNGYAGHTQEILAALSHGYTLTLDSLDEALVGAGVSRIACQGQIFDPRRMTAVDIDETSTVPEGTVVEVYRNGYEWNGEVHRTAQVKVARPPERKSA